VTGHSDRAYDRLREGHAELVESYDAIINRTSGLATNLTVGEKMFEVVSKKLEIMTQKQWKLRWRNKSKPVRVLVDRVVRVIRMIKDLAISAASLDPIHAGIPLAGLCILLTVSLHLRT
jgi:hypothetical protein